jgi:hypothetical protein
MTEHDVTEALSGHRHFKATFNSRDSDDVPYRAKQESNNNVLEVRNT